MELDRSKAVFSARLSDFSKPAITLDFSLDEIDLDLYLPPATEAPAPAPGASDKAPPPAAKTDYGALRTLVLDAGIRVGKMKAKGARLEKLNLRVTGKNGELTVKPAAELYKGTLQGEAKIDLRAEAPKSGIRLKVTGIEANPFMQDLMNKDILAGTGSAELTLRFVGDTEAAVRKSLNGEGSLLFSDGAIKGIDLAGMVRNVEAALGLAQPGGERPRTDFSELRIPFNVRDGVADISGSSLASPFLRLSAGGKADLVREILDIRVEPKLVATIKGQGDVKDRSGITVPVLITGSFNDPKFRPDLKSILQQKIEERLPPGVREEAEKLLKSGETPAADRVQDLLKKLPLRR
jgi:AsmA protein